MPISRSSKKTVLITMGDPSGIGPEVTLKALASPKVKALADFLVIGDGVVVENVKKDLRLKFDTPFLDIHSNLPRLRYGRNDPAFGMASVRYIDEALKLLADGCASALVTAPINKLSIRSAGFPGFEGHTEYLAGKTSSKDVAMIFLGGKMKVSLVTRHIALKDVSKALTIDKVLKTIAITHKGLKARFGIKDPRIGVAGLNPHAGEGGIFGKEEERVIIPAIKKAGKLLGRVTGPYPPDVIFHDLCSGKFDAVVAMYHDQALIPFKLLHFRDGVNLTLGLPFPRTSPDHGTAFDIAGKGIADPSSMIEAIRVACRLSGR